MGHQQAVKWLASPEAISVQEIIETILPSRQAA
jgi:hypothetical protein